MLKEKIKELITKKDIPNKKKIENLVVFLILLVITIVAINVIWKDNSKENSNLQQSEYKQLANIPINNTTETSTSEKDLEEKLENILSKIYGVGKVSVLITYNESSQIVAMYNENLTESVTEETDNNGGKRTIQETDSKKDVVYEENSGTKVPITQKVVMPKIEGAIVIAEGANDAIIKTNITQAVEAVTGLATYKIQVFEMEKI